MTEKNDYTDLAIPKGEWLDIFLLTLKKLGLEFSNSTPRSYEYTSLALPMMRLVAIRSKEVWTAITRSSTSTQGGFTGSDVAIEQGINGYDLQFYQQLLQSIGGDESEPDYLPITNQRTWELPIRQLNPDYQQPKVYVGASQKIAKALPRPTIENLRGQTIYTEYSNITRAIFARRGINAIPVNVEPVQGGSEAWSLLNRSGGGVVVTIRQSDATMKANKIELIQDILPVKLVYIEQNMSEIDRLRVDDFREKIYQALKGKYDN